MRWPGGRFALAGIVPAAVVLALGVAVPSVSASPAAPGTAPPGPDVYFNQPYEFYNGTDSGCVRAHAHNYVLQDGACDQTWTVVSARTMAGRTWGMLQLDGTDECANYDISSVYLDDCVAGDDDEYFSLVVDPTFGGAWNDIISYEPTQTYGWVDDALPDHDIDLGVGTQGYIAAVWDAIPE